MYATNYFEAAMLNLMRNTAITAPTTVYLALFTSNPTDEGITSTETLYSGYSRKAITFSAPATDGNGLSITNSADITFTESTVNYGNAAYVGVMDSLTSGNMLLYSQLDTPLNIQIGVSPVFKAGTVKWTWSGNLSTYYRTAIMNTLRGTNCSGFLPYIGLSNGDPNGSGNEFSGNNYARVRVTMTTPAQQDSGPAQVENTTDVLSPVSSSYWGVLNYAGIYDALTEGHLFMSLPLGTDYTITSNNAAGFHAGDLKININ